MPKKKKELIMIEHKETKQYGKCENCLYEGEEGENGCPRCNDRKWWHSRE